MAMAKTKQRLLTIQLGRALQTFIEQSRNGTRIVSMCPHYNDAAMLMGYLVVVEDDPAEFVTGEP